MDLGQRHALRIDGDAAAIVLQTTRCLSPQVKEHAEYLQGGPEAQICFAQRDEARQLRDAVCPQMVGLQPVETQKFPKEGVRRKPQSALQMRGEDDELALLRLGRNLSQIGRAHV